MKCVIREVKDFQPYITRKTIAYFLSLFIAFYLDGVVFLMGATAFVWIIFYCLIYLYSYIFLNALIYVFTKENKKRSKFDFKVYLIDKGFDVYIKSKGVIFFVDIFTKKVYYSVKDSNFCRQTYCFDIKKNICELQDKNKNV